MKADPKWAFVSNNECREYLVQLYYRPRSKKWLIIAHSTRATNEYDFGPVALYSERGRLIRALNIYRKEYQSTFDQGAFENTLRQLKQNGKFDRTKIKILERMIEATIRK